MPVYIFIDLPHIFLNGIPKSSIMVNTGESLRIGVTYEILQTYYNHDCKKYSMTYNQSFDACKFEVLEKVIPKSTLSLHPLHCKYNLKL